MRPQRPRAVWTALATWHLDEIYLKIDGRMGYLWRAVDAEGEVLDVLVQSKRNKHAALNLMRKLLKKYAYAPGRLVTADLRRSRHDLGIERLHQRGRWKNNRAENSHLPTRRRERKVQRFKSAGSAQKFLSIHAAVLNTFSVQRHRSSAQTHRTLRTAAMSNVARDRRGRLKIRMRNCMQTVAASRAKYQFPYFFRMRASAFHCAVTRTWFGVIRPRRRSRQVDEIAIHDNSSGAHQSRALTAVRATFEP
jgi:transposase-like protein